MRPCPIRLTSGLRLIWAGGFLPRVRVYLLGTRHDLMDCSTRLIGWVIAGVVASPCILAQKTTSAPPTDSSALSSPVKPAPKAPATDAAFESSPEIGPAERHGVSIAPGTAIHAVLVHAIDSGKLKNGQNVPARLEAPVKTSAGTLPAGTPVMISVIGTVPAGKLTAVGEFSLEVVKVGGVGTDTDVKTYRGEPGKREVADAAPAVGTNAGLPAGAAIVFKVAKPPTAAENAPKQSANTPGSVNGIAKGSPGQTAGGSNSGEPTYGDTKSVLSPAPATPAGANQTAAPSGEKQNGTVQPH